MSRLLLPILCAALVGFTLLLPHEVDAGASDLALFSAGGGAPPNILLLLDSSGSMRREPSGRFKDPSCDRKFLIGGGLPSNPKVSLGADPEDDKIYIKTSTGQIAVVDAPPRPDSRETLIYCRRKF